MTDPVQSAYVQTQASTPGVVAFTNNTAQHNTVVVVASVFSNDGLNATLPLPTTADGTYVAALNAGLNSINCGAAVFVVKDCAVGKFNTSVKSNAATPDNNCYLTVSMYEFPGLTSNPVDKSNSATTVNGGVGETSQVTGSTGTLSQASELVLVLCGIDDNPGIVFEGVTVPSGFTPDPNIAVGQSQASFQDTTNFIGLMVGWMDVSATTALNPSFGVVSRSTTTSTTGGIVTFKKAASGGGSAVTWLLTH